MIKFVIRITYVAVILIQGLVISSIVLQFINANRDNSLVSWIKNRSAFFINPFEGIVTASVGVAGLSIPMDSIIALLFYIIIAFILSELLKIFTKE